MRKPRPPSAVEEMEAPLTSRDDPRLRQLFGRPEVRRLSALIQRMATGHKHGNQLFKLRDVLVLHLVAFYNPMIRSLRTFDVASQAEKVQEWMDIPRMCRSTLRPEKGHEKNRLSRPGVIFSTAGGYAAACAASAWNLLNPFPIHPAHSIA